MGNDDWVAPAIGGGIVAIALDELFVSGPRVRRANQAGFNQGWYSRDAQLQPVVSSLQNQVTNLQNTVLDHERALGRIEGALVTTMGFANELLKKLGEDKMDKKQLEEMIRANVVETLNQLSVQVREAKKTPTYR